MKKLIAILSLFVFCFSFAASNADEPKELLFQSVPWFSTPEEASQILLDAGFISKAFDSEQIGKDSTTKSRVRKGGSPYTECSIAADPKDKKCPYTYVSDKYPALTGKLEYISVRGLPKTIAKQKIKSLNLYFTPDAENRQLVQCKLVLELRHDTKAIRNALEEAYGKPSAIKNKKYYIWLGANNTIVLYNTQNSKPFVIFASIDGLNLAESYEVEITEPAEPDDTGF